MTASERESAPTSSSETPQPRVRSAVSVRSTISGCSVNAVSVISIIRVALPRGRSGKLVLQHFGVGVEEQRERCAEARPRPLR